MTITLPASFRGRRDNVEIILVPRNYYFGGAFMALWTRTSLPRWMPYRMWHVLEVDEALTNFDLTNPKIVINAYTRIRRQHFDDLDPSAHFSSRTYQENYYDITFDVIVIGR